MDYSRPYIHVHGVQPNIPQKKLRDIFKDFGKITSVKLYDKGFAHIFFETLGQAQNAVKTCSNNSLIPWKVYIGKGTETDITSNSILQSEELDTNDKTMYRPENINSYTPTDDYVDIHGNKLRTMRLADGEIYILLKDIRATGYHIFHKDNYDPVLIDRKEVIDEFYNHLLGEARKFLLKNHISFIDEKKIMDAIEKARGRLFNGTENSTLKLNSYASNRSVVPDQNKSLKITTNVETSQNHQTSPTNLLRPPNSIPFDLSVNSSKNKYTNVHLQPQMNRPKPYANQNETYNKHHCLNTTSESSRQPIKNNTNFRGYKQNKYNDGPSNRNGDQSDRESVKSDKSSIKSEKLPVLSKPKEILKPVTLKNEFQEVVISHIEEGNLIWANLKSNAKDVSEIVGSLLDVESQKIIDANVGTLCIAQFEGDWYRALVIDVKPIKVLYVDFGNVGEVKYVKSIKSSLAKYPSQAVKIKLNDLCGKTISLQDELTVKPLKQLDDGTYLCTMNKNENVPNEPVSPKPLLVQKFIGVPRTLGALKHGDIVRVIGESNGILLTRTKQCVDKLKEVNQLLKEHTGIPLTEVTVGQVVLCKKDEIDYRAVVEKTNPNIVVKYLDIPGTDTVTLDKLKSVNEALAKAHQTILQLPKIKGVDNFSDKANQTIFDAINNKCKFVVEKVNGAADLIYEDGAKFTEKITETVNKVNEEPVTVKYEDMLIYEPPLGTNSYMVFSCDVYEFTLLPTGTQETEWLNSFLNFVDDKQIYHPQEKEMCMATYEDMWCRGAVLEIKDNGYTIFFVDYGNIDNIQPENIRRLSKDFKTIPILGVQCELMGLPDDETVQNKVKELCPDGSIYDVDFVKKDSEDKYYIKIPVIESKLKSENLI